MFHPNLLGCVAGKVPTVGVFVDSVSAVHRITASVVPSVDLPAVDQIISCLVGNVLLKSIRSKKNFQRYVAM